MQDKAKKINDKEVDFKNLLENRNSMFMKDSDMLYGQDMKDFSEQDYKNMI